jgi:hypothetical protein
MAAVIPIKYFQTHQNAPRTATTHPVDAYLGRLGVGSRRGFRIALANLAEIASNGKADLYGLGGHPKAAM